MHDFKTLHIDIEGQTWVIEYDESHELDILSVLTHAVREPSARSVSRHVQVYQHSSSKSLHSAVLTDLEVQELLCKALQDKSNHDRIQ